MVVERLKKYILLTNKFSSSKHIMLSDHDLAIIESIHMILIGVRWRFILTTQNLQNPLKNK